MLVRGLPMVLFLAACSANVDPAPTDRTPGDVDDDPPMLLPMDPGPTPPDGRPSSETCDNGFDDDGNGAVDDGCACEPAQTQPCFPGDPSLAGVGICLHGAQTCVVSGEFGVWGECEGAAGPEEEVCDGIDNDCNGAVDDGTGACPEPPPPEPPPPEPPPMEPPPSCRDGVDLSPRFPHDVRSVTATTCGGADIASLFCNGGAAPEAYYNWTSPDEDYQVEWEVSTGFVVGLAQAEESCRPGPFFCEYEDGAFYAHTHTLVVERSGGGCGEFTLSVRRVY